MLTSFYAIPFLQDISALEPSDSVVQDTPSAKRTGTGRIKDGDINRSWPRAASIQL